MIPAFGQHRDIDDDADFARSIGGKDPAARVSIEIAMDDGCRNARTVESSREFSAWATVEQKITVGRALAFSCQCRTTSSVTGARFMICATSVMS